MNKISKELVSIIIPTFGRSDFLLRAVRSALNQTYENIEIIVVDDNGEGTENQEITENKLKPYLLNEIRLKYIPHQLNLNGAAARNTGIKISNGEYICFLDDDDEFEKDKIQKQYDKLIKSKYNACYCGHSRINNNNVVSIYKPKSEGNILFPLLMHKIDACTGSTLMLKRSLLEKVKGFDVTFKRHQDYEFIARVAYNTHIAVVSEPLVKIHMHNGSYSQKNYTDIKETRKLYNTKMRQCYNKLDSHQIKSLNYNNSLINAKIALKHRKLRDFIFYVIKSKNYRIIIDLGKDAFKFLLSK